MQEQILDQLKEINKTQKESQKLFGQAIHSITNILKNHQQMLHDSIANSNVTD